jgi:serine/threonine-protein kinase
VDASADSRAGRLVDDRYEILERVARGGMASVYRARDLRLERIVAVKIMHPHLAESTDFVRRFRREARAAARLSHPGVVAVHDQGVTGESSYLAMEFVDGPNLRAELRARGSLTLGQSLDVVEQVLDALAAAHRAGLVHRDIKPENILVTADGRVKVADFGLARAISETTAATSGTVLGTVAYIAPETVLDGVADPPADVYGVGIVAYELITGHQPFSGTTPAQVAFQHVNSHVPAPSASWPAVPREVDDLVAALTAQDPDERPKDAGEALALVRRTRAALSDAVLDQRSAVAPADPVDFADESEPPSGGGSDARETDQAPHEENDPAGRAVAIPIGAIQPGTSAGPRRAQTSRTADTSPGSAASPAGAADTNGYVPAHARTSPTTAGGSSRPPAPRGSDPRGTDPRVADTQTRPRPAGPGTFQGHDTAPIDAPGLTRASTTADVPRVGTAPAGPRPGSTRSGDTRAIPVSGSGRGRRRHGRRGLLVAALLAVLLVVGAGAWALMWGPLAGQTVPDVTGRPSADAIDTLESAGFAPEPTQAYSDDVAEGNVISTTPEAGTRTRSEDITVVVSQGVEILVVPDVVGLSEAEATEAIENARLTVGESETEYHDTVPAGEVIRTVPDGGQSHPHDEPVVLVVSDGREPAEIPALEGLTRTEAESALDDAGLVPDVSEDYSETVPEGEVVSQSPGSDAEAFVGDTVEVVVSLGPEEFELPSVINLSIEEATEQLQALGLEVDREDVLGAYYGTVRSQEPSAGTLVTRGDTITLRVV